MKMDIIYAQIGTPKSSTPEDIEAYLNTFLSSKRIVGEHTFIWKLFVKHFIAPRRSKKISSRYKMMEKLYGENPTFIYTNEFISNMQSFCTNDINYLHCFALDETSIKSCEKNIREDAIRFIVPLYPQFSKATYEMIFDTISKRFKAISVRKFPHREEYIQQTIEKLSHVEADTLLLSFHSYPIKMLSDEDTYYADCIQDFHEIEKRLNEFKDIRIEMCFQSKFGTDEWLSPSTEDAIENCIARGDKKVAIHSPSFLINSIETSWELGIDLKNKYSKHSIEIDFIQCPTPLYSSIDTNKLEKLIP